MTDQVNARLHAVVSGKVQGVSFRYFVVDRAKALSLTGWVRNLWNGNVEVTAEGSREDLEKLLQALHQGPPMARVALVNTDWEAYQGEFNGFHVRSTTA
jgi:acylphosphatase